MENVPYTLFMYTVHHFTLLVRLLFGSKIIFADTAHRAGPIGWKIFKGDIVVISGIVDIAANIANVLFHNLFPFSD